ncbi:hypothetical protein Sjap_000381 [Stephania japonica]|uniref:Pectin acetylesterase n=1 Tax=Stephania japonica TaxID=461633 RepID=A0AAP0KHY7_9MAGN
MAPLQEAPFVHLLTTHLTTLSIVLRPHHCLATPHVSHVTPHAAPHVDTTHACMHALHAWWHPRMQCMRAVRGGIHACSACVTMHAWDATPDFRSQMLDAVEGFSKSKKNGVFINSCFAHVQTERKGMWFAYDSPMISNKITTKTARHHRGHGEVPDDPHACHSDRNTPNHDFEARTRQDQIPLLFGSPILPLQPHFLLFTTTTTTTTTTKTHNLTKSKLSKEQPIAATIPYTPSPPLPLPPPTTPPLPPHQSLLSSKVRGTIVQTLT